VLFADLLIFWIASDMWRYYCAVCISSVDILNFKFIHEHYCVVRGLFVDIPAFTLSVGYYCVVVWLCSSKGLVHAGCWIWLLVVRGSKLSVVAFSLCAFG